MFRFLTNILMISIFFIGLGAISERVWKELNPNSLEDCEMRQSRVIRISGIEKPQIQMMLPKVQELPKTEEPTAQMKVVILRKSAFVE